jgi:hypothetical protein
VCRDTLPKVTTCGDRTRVVDSSSLVVHADVRCTSFGEALLETISAGCASGAIRDHLGDLTSWARARYRTTIVAGSCSVVTLHKTRIRYAIVSGRCSHAAIALFQHDGKNKARIDAGRGRDGLDGGRNFADFLS